MLVRGKKTGLCYRWEEAACLPTPAQVEVLHKYLPLGPEFDAALAEAYADKERAQLAARAKAREEAARSTDVLTFAPPTRKQHPCEKPVPLIERLALAVPTAHHIADYFMGSGTTGVACARMGRRFTGIERDAKHFDTACKRIEQAQAQQALLPEPARECVQAGLL
jgi:DNA modification methylase